MNKRRSGIDEAMKMADQTQGMMPPQAEDLEQAVLGALMLETKCFNVVSEFLTAEMFYKEKHGLIYRACATLNKTNRPIDILTVTHQLRAEGVLQDVGGAVYISQLTKRVASTANVAEHSMIILQCFLGRELIKIGREIANESYNPTIDVFEVLEKAQKSLISLSNDYIPTAGLNISSAVDQIAQEVSERSEGKVVTGGVTSVMNEVNRVIGKWSNSDLVTIAARPAIGKTAFIISDAVGMALRGEPVGFFSLEMSTVQIVYRIASQITHIDVSTLTRSKMDNDRMKTFYLYVDKIKKLPIHFDDTPALSVQKLRTRAHKMKEKHGIKILFVDYLQLLTSKSGQSRSGNREQEVSEISRTLKQIAKELDIPVIALSQLSRQVESRPDKRPMLSDLRESGSIEQDSDIVGFLWRPSYYGKTVDADGNAIPEDYAELIIAKHRNGSVADVPLRYQGYYTMYSDRESTWNQAAKEGIEQAQSLKPNTDFMSKAPF